MMTPDKHGHITRMSDSSLYMEVCTLCGATDGRGDYRLDEPCPGAGAMPMKAPSALSEQRSAALELLIQSSAKAMAALSPVDRAILEVQQKQSWVRGNVGLAGADRGAIDHVLSSQAEMILMNEVLRLRQLHPEFSTGKFRLEDAVRKKSGSCWRGFVRGFYTTELTPIGYVVESASETGSVQNYPEAALEKWDASAENTAGLALADIHAGRAAEAKP